MNIPDDFIKYYDIVMFEVNTRAIATDKGLLYTREYQNEFVFSEDIQKKIDSGEITYIVQVMYAHPSNQVFALLRDGRAGAENDPTE